MKKGLIFFLGMITGAILTIILAYLINTNSAINSGNSSTTALYGDPGITLFDEPGEQMKLVRFKVFQCLENGTALAQSSYSVEFPMYGEPVVLFLPAKNGSYYDGQIITVDNRKSARQIGIYRYETRQDKFIKQVPIVDIFDK